MRCYKATAPPNAAPAAPQNSTNVATPRAARRVKILFFRMLIMHGGFFVATGNSSGYCDWPQSNAEKRGAVKDKLFPAFISRRSAAQRGEAQRSLQCSPCYDKQYSLSFLTCSAARRGAARRPVGPYLQTNEMGERC